jgi:hypothetical protein
MNPGCPHECDCSHPSECLFGPPTPERPSFAAVWGLVACAVLVAVVALIVVALL